MNEILKYIYDSQKTVGIDVFEKMFNISSSISTSLQAVDIHTRAKIFIYENVEKEVNGVFSIKYHLPDFYAEIRNNHNDNAIRFIWGVDHEGTEVIIIGFYNNYKVDEQNIMHKSTLPVMETVIKFIAINLPSFAHQVHDFLDNGDASFDFSFNSKALALH
jgi:hypothetical protein